MLNPLPLSFSASRTHVFSALLQGSGVYFYPLLFSAQQLADTMLAGEATSLCAVPTIVRNLFELFGDPSTPVFCKARGSSIASGRQWLQPRRSGLRRRLCANFVQVYGASICGRISTLSGSDLEARPDTLGRVLPHVTLQLVDADDKVLPAGEAGADPPALAGHGAEHLWRDTRRALATVSKEVGPIQATSAPSTLTVTCSSWGAPRTSSSVAAPMYIPPRSRSSSRNVDGVRDVAVVGFTKLPEGEEIAAFVVGADDLTEAALVAHCRVRLGPDKRPRKFVFVKDLPRNANGKISRAELRQQLEAARLEAITSLWPREIAVPASLAARWIARTILA